MQETHLAVKNGVGGEGRNAVKRASVAFFLYFLFEFLFG